MSTRLRHLIMPCVLLTFVMALMGCQRSKPPRTVVPYYPGNMAAAEPTAQMTATVASLVATSTPMSYPGPATPTVRPTITLPLPTVTAYALPTHTVVASPATVTAVPYQPPASPTWTAVPPPTLAPTAVLTPTATLMPSGDLTYTVSSGDTLISLAAQNQTTVYAIMDRNGLYDPNTIRVGQKLVIPVGNQVTGTLPSGPVSHIVKKGETLSSLARRYRTTVGEIQAQNPGLDPQRLSVGTTLSITVGTAPVVRTHVVRRGDTLSSIARRYGTTMRALAQANPVANPNRLRVGQVLVIPQ